MGGCGDLIDLHTPSRVKTIPYTPTVERLLGDPRVSSRPVQDDALIYRLKRTMHFIKTGTHDRQYWK